MAHGGSETGPGTVSDPRDWEKITLFVFGTFFFIVLLAMAWVDPHPSASSWYIYIWVLAMAAGGVAALLPGAIEVKLNPGIRAGGAVAIAVLVIYFGQGRATDDKIVQGLKSHLDPVPGSVIDPMSDVYVVINSKLATYKKGGTGPKDLDFGVNDWKGAKQASVKRGAGGWLISSDMTVPEGELAMRKSSLDEARERSENGQ
jgi:hypothetical protein